MNSLKYLEAILSKDDSCWVNNCITIATVTTAMSRMDRIFQRNIITFVTT